MSNSEDNDRIYDVSKGVSAIETHISHILTAINDIKYNQREIKETQKDFENSVTQQLDRKQQQINELERNQIRIATVIKFSAIIASFAGSMMTYLLNKFIWVGIK
jgi:FtsZ-binding cell division protein ZapB